MTPFCEGWFYHGNGRGEEAVKKLYAGRYSGVKCLILNE